MKNKETLSQIIEKIRENEVDNDKYMVYPILFIPLEHLIFIEGKASIKETSYLRALRASITDDYGLISIVMESKSNEFFLGIGVPPHSPSEDITEDNSIISYRFINL